MRNFMALKRLVTACLAFISVICIAGCSFFDDVVHLKNDNEAKNAASGAGRRI